MSVGNSVSSRVDRSRMRLKDTEFQISEKYSNLLF